MSQYVGRMRMGLLSRGTFFLLAAGMSGCMSLTPRTVAPTIEPVVVAAGYDKTWSAVIDHFAENSIPIKTLEKASGLIVSERMAVGVSNSGKWVDCGSFYATFATYNVRVQSTEQGATVRVTALWVPSTTMAACATRGVYERDLMQAIKIRAETR